MPNSNLQGPKKFQIPHSGIRGRPAPGGVAACLPPVLFGMKNAEGVIPSLPARNERGERLERGETEEKRPPLPKIIAQLLPIDWTRCTGCQKKISEMVGQTCRFAATTRRSSPTISEIFFWPSLWTIDCLTHLAWATRRQDLPNPDSVPPILHECAAGPRVRPRGIGQLETAHFLAVGHLPQFDARARSGTFGHSLAGRKSGSTSEAMASLRKSRRF